jgi:hypothetical protein
MPDREDQATPPRRRRKLNSRSGRYLVSCDEGKGCGRMKKIVLLLVLVAVGLVIAKQFASSE